MTTDTTTAGPCACGRFQSFPANLPPLADGTMHVPVLPTPPLCEVIALGQERVRLTAELAATISCGHAGEDSACLECLACERYDRACSARRVQQLEEELVAAERQRDGCRSDASRMGELWVQAVRDLKATEARAEAVDAAARALLASEPEHEEHGVLRVEEHLVTALRVALKEPTP